MPNEQSFIMDAAKAEILAAAERLRGEIKRLETELEDTVRRSTGQPLEQLALEISQGTRQTSLAFLVEALLALFVAGEGLVAPDRFHWPKAQQALGKRGVRCTEDRFLEALRSRPDLFEPTGRAQTWYVNLPTPRAKAMVPADAG